GAHGRRGLWIDIPRFRHLVGSVKRPGRALESVAFGQILCGPGTKSGPPTLFPGGILWQFEWRIKEFLALVLGSAVKEKLIHEIANSNSEALFSCRKLLVGSRQCLLLEMDHCTLLSNWQPVSLH